MDREEAILAGAEAVKAAVEGKTGVMIGFERLPGAEYAVRPIHIPIQQVMLTERTMPDEFINRRGNGVTDAFDWRAAAHLRHLQKRPVRRKRE